MENSGYYQHNGDVVMVVFHLSSSYGASFEIVSLVEKQLFQLNLIDFGLEKENINLIS